MENLLHPRLCRISSINSRTQVRLCFWPRHCSFLVSNQQRYPSGPQEFDELAKPRGDMGYGIPTWVQEHYVNVKGVNKGVDKCYFNTHWHLCWMIRISSSTKTSIQLSNWLDESTASRLLYRIRETPVIPKGMPLNLTSIHQGQQIWDTFMSELWPDGVLEAEWLRNHQSHLTTISLPRNENTNRRSLVAFLCPWMQPNWQPRNMWHVTSRWTLRSEPKI